MSWVAVAAGGGALLGGILQSGAATGAANTQAGSAGQAQNLQQGMYNQNQQNISPWIQSGGANNNYLNFLLGTPGYNSPTGGSALNPNNLAVNPQTGRQWTQNDFQTYYQGIGDTSIAQDSAIGYQKYLSGANNAAFTSPAWNSVFPGSAQGIPAGQAGALPGAQPAGTAQGGQAGMAPGGGPGGFGSLTQPFGMAQFQQSPGYQFNLSQGQMAIDKAAASRGNFYAPQTLQDVSKFSQGLASNEFQQGLQNYMGQNQQTYNMLSGQSAQGLSGANALAGVSSNFANMIGGNIMGAGNALAAGQVGAANAYNPAISAFTNPGLYSQFLQQQQNPGFNQNLGYGYGNINDMSGAGGFGGGG